MEKKVLFYRLTLANRCVTISVETPKVCVERQASRCPHVPS